MRHNKNSWLEDFYGMDGIRNLCVLGNMIFCGIFLARRLDGMNGTRNLCMRIKYGTYGTDGTSCWMYSMIVGVVQLESSRS